MNRSRHLRVRKGRFERKSVIASNGEESASLTERTTQHVSRVVSPDEGFESETDSLPPRQALTVEQQTAEPSADSHLQGPSPSARPLHMFPQARDVRAVPVRATMEDPSHASGQIENCADSHSEPDARVKGRQQSSAPLFPWAKNKEGDDTEKWLNRTAMSHRIKYEAPRHLPSHLTCMCPGLVGSIQSLFKENEFVCLECGLIRNEEDFHNAFSNGFCGFKIDTTSQLGHGQELRPSSTTNKSLVWLNQTPVFKIGDFGRSKLSVFNADESSNAVPTNDTKYQATSSQAPLTSISDIDFANFVTPQIFASEDPEGALQESEALERLSASPRQTLLHTGSETREVLLGQQSATLVQTSSALPANESTTSSSVTADDESITSDDIFEEAKDILLDKLMGLFRAKYFMGLSSMFDGHNFKSHQDVSNSPTTSGHQTTASSFSGSASGGGKRRRDAEDGNEGKRDGESMRRKQSRGPSKDEALNVANRFACPFFKRKPHRYISKKSCPGPGWKDVHRLKEHLYRCHMRPVDCNRCGACFDSAALLREHQRAEVSCDTRDYITPEGVTQEQKNELRSRKKTAPDMTECEKWKKAYRILFPDDDPQAMPSPYYEIAEDSKASQAFSAADVYEDFLRHDLPAHIRHQFALEIERQIGPIEDRIRLLLPDIVHRAHRLFWTSASTSQGNSSIESSSTEEGESRIVTPLMEDSPDVVQAPSGTPPVSSQGGITRNTMEDFVDLSMPAPSQPSMTAPWPQYDFSSIIDEMQFRLHNEDDSDPWVAANRPHDPFPEFSRGFE